MGEIVRTDNQQNRVRKWTRVGVLLFCAILVFSFYFLAQKIYLIPPLFQLSLPIFFFVWFPFLILWVLLTPSRKRLLLLIIPGILYVLLTWSFLAPSFLGDFFFIGQAGYIRCFNLPAEEGRLYACNAVDVDYSDRGVYLYHGGNFSLFLKSTTDMMPTQLDLAGANLKGKFLYGLDLSDSILIGADLEGANLSYADLSDVDLTGANLSNTNLNQTVFRRANLTGVNFDSAVLTKTNFNMAILDNESLESAAVINQVLLPENKIYNRQ